MIDKCVAGYILSICAEGLCQIVKDGARSQPEAKNPTVK